MSNKSINYSKLLDHRTIIEILYNTVMVMCVTPVVDCDLFTIEDVVATVGTLIEIYITQAIMDLIL